MITVTATTLYDNFFQYLDRAAAGETIAILHHNREIVYLIPAPSSNWRDGLQQELTILVDSQNSNSTS